MKNRDASQANSAPVDNKKSDFSFIKTFTESFSALFSHDKQSDPKKNDLQESLLKPGNYKKR